MIHSEWEYNGDLLKLMIWWENISWQGNIWNTIPSFPAQSVRVQTNIRDDKAKVVNKNAYINNQT